MNKLQKDIELNLKGKSRFQRWKTKRNIRKLLETKVKLVREGKTYLDDTFIKIMRLSFPQFSYIEMRELKYDEIMTDVELSRTLRHLDKSDMTIKDHREHIKILRQKK